MRIAVLGGLGIQGQATLVDLAQSEAVEEIICADMAQTPPAHLKNGPGRSKITYTGLDASSRESLVSLFKKTKPDAVIDLLPVPLMATAAEAGIAAGVSVVGTNYPYTVRHLDAQAREAGVIIMTESGLDPGIDLVIIGHWARQFEELRVLDSYCGGLPEARAADNPLQYKISWNWATVLVTQTRDSVFIADGQRIEVPGKDQHESAMIHEVDFPGLGRLEAIPNGDAVRYADLLGVAATIRRTGRYSLRWPGWCAFWRPLKRLGFLEDTPVPGLPGGITPRQFLTHHLEPRLQYRADEKDLAVMLNIFEGLSGGRRRRLTTRLVIERDLTTGIMAMSMGVGYTASIVAQMIGRGRITGSGLLSPLKDVPYQEFMAELAARGIRIEESDEYIG